MPIKKWLTQYAVALPVTALLLASIQFMKGQSLTYSIEFGLIWSLISVFIFASRRYYFFRKKVHCAVCNDIERRT